MKLLKYLLLLSILFFTCFVFSQGNTENDTAYINLIEQANNQYNSGNYADALHSCEEIINNKIANDNDKQDAFFKIGKIYLDLEESSLALSYLKKSLKIALKLNDSTQIAYLYNSFGSYYKLVQRIDSSIIYYSKALELFKITKNEQGIAGANNNLAITYFNNLDYEKALSHYSNSFRIAKKYNISKDMSLYLLNIGATYKKLQKSKKALFSFKESYAIADSAKNKLNKLRAAKELYFYFKDRNDDINALKYFEIYHETDKEVFSIQLQQEITDLKSRINIQQKNNKISLLTKEKALSEAKVKNKNFFIVILIIVFLLAVLLAIFILKRKTFKQQILTQKLDKERVESELRKKELELIKEKSDSKSRELTSICLIRDNKNELLQDIKNSVLSYKETNDEKTLNQLCADIDNNLRFENDWEVFKLHFEEVHPEFFERLKFAYPQLTQNNLKLCAYIKIGLSNKEISRLLLVSPESIKTAKKRLKKKLNILPGDNFSF